MMGAFVSCFHISDARDNDSSSTDNDCLCPRCFLRRIMNKGFTRVQIRSISSQGQPVPSSNLEAVYNYPTDAAETYDEDMPYRVEYKCRGGVSHEVGEVGVRERKGTCCSQVQPEPVRCSDHLSSLKFAQASTMSSQEQNPETSVKLPSLKAKSIFVSAFPSSDDEDVCPTCFEEYTQENPKIIAECSHHYHLGCIYEWMERSRYCPVCNQLMIFNEQVETSARRIGESPAEPNDMDIQH